MTVTVPASGTVLVTVTSMITTTMLPYPFPSSPGAYVSFQSSGGKGDVKADVSRALGYVSSYSGGIQASATYMVSGLSAGTHTFFLVYMARPYQTTFTYRSITVVPLA